MTKLSVESSVPRVHDGKLAIVTGSARSIGSHIARNLASKGCNVIINYVSTASDDSANQLAEELSTKHNVKAVPCRADISTGDGCDLIISTCKEHFANAEGKLQIDILVHNAAVLYLGPLESVNEEDFHRNFSVNVLGPIRLTGACKPYLPTDRSGRIVLVSSINPKVGTPNTTLYSGAKGALEGMCRVWCRELAERATVNAINPGPTMTDMYLTAPDSVKEQLALWNPLTPLVAVREDDGPEIQEMGKKFGGRAAYPEEIANMVGMICSPESGWMTGSLVSSNGGLTFSV